MKKRFITILLFSLILVGCVNAKSNDKENYSKTYHHRHCNHKRHNRKMHHKMSSHYRGN